MARSNGPASAHRLILLEDVPLMNKLTLCLIARDEEAFLADCLASVRDVVDEMIVVDTGSSDGTIEIAEQAGARIVRHAWNDDFAAARNAAIEQVSGGFVLILDADERLAPGAGAVIRSALKADSLDVGRLPLHNASAINAPAKDVLSGAASQGPPVLLERLLRHTPDLRWEGVVHEHVTRWAAQGRRFETLDAPIIHLGAVPELRKALGKSQRNLRLLERAAQQEPNNAVYQTYLGQDLLHAGEIDRATAAIEQAWKLLEKQHASDGPAADCIATATLRAFLQLRQDRFGDAEATLVRARQWSGVHPNLYLMSAVLDERRWFASGESADGSQLLENAAAACDACFGFDGRALTSLALPGATSWVAATRLGTIRLLQGSAKKALVAFEAALKRKPDHTEALLGRAEALIFSGRAQSALGELMPLLERELPDAWILAARAGFEFESYEQVAPMIERGRASLTTTDLIAPHRRWFLDELEAASLQGGIA